MHIFIYATTPHPFDSNLFMKQACQASEFQRAVLVFHCFKWEKLKCIPSPPPNIGQAPKILL